MKAYSCALYPTKELDKAKTYLDQLKQYGCSGLFTSLHMPEFTEDEQFEFLNFLIEEGRKRNLPVCADLGGAGLKKALDNPKRLEILKGLGSLRLDYGADLTLAKALEDVLKGVQLVLNTSVLNPNELEQFAALKGVTASCHNFYPRPESGLDKAFAKAQNERFRNKGLSVTFCIPTYDHPRRPIEAGLVSVEDHRNKGLEELLQECLLENWGDDYLFGDEWLKEESLALIQSYFCSDVLPVDVQFVSDCPKEMKQIVLGRHHFRYDSNVVFLRSQSSRQMAERSGRVSPFHWIHRSRGAVTVDNERYGRYSGEMQVVCQDRPKDDRVNVAGFVDENGLKRLMLFRLGFDYEFRECAYEGD